MDTDEGELVAVAGGVEGNDSKSVSTLVSPADKAGDVKATADVAGPVVDFQFYRTLWGLQALFSNPREVCNATSELHAWLTKVTVYMCDC